MNEWLLLVLSASIGSIFSLVGGFYLLYGKKGAATLQRYAVPFAAGALLAATFFDLLPESLEGKFPSGTILSWVLIGFLLFFLLERFLHWFHHHHLHNDDRTELNASLIIIGDAIHNFIDGLAIGAAFLVNPAIGIAVTVAVAAHEIPQEIGDFGLLLNKGMRRRNVVLVNIFSALVTVIGAVIVFALGQETAFPAEILLAITAGFFIYIAASDIIPTIHQQQPVRQANTQALVLLIGVAIVMFVTQIAHQYIHEISESQVNGKEMHHHDE